MPHSGHECLKLQIQVLSVALLSSLCLHGIELFNHKDLGQSVIEQSLLFFILKDSTEAKFKFSGWKYVKLQIIEHYFGIDEP